jgi:hypothetical protein
MWDPQHLTTLYTSTACYGDSFTIFSFQKIKYPDSTEQLKQWVAIQLMYPVLPPRRYTELQK